MSAPLVARRHAISFAIAIAIGLGAVACEKLDAAADPVWGKEPCGHCAMLVGDRLHAAQVVAGGERKFFDDIGCFVLWAEEHPGAAQKAWVRDAETPRWIDARSASYAHGARTPMDFGFEARGVSAQSEETVGFEAMRQAVVRRVRRESGERSER